MTRRIFVPVVVLLLAIAATAQNVAPVARDVIEARERDLKDKNKDRAAELRSLFQQAGCGDHLTDGVVKKSKLPNIICTLPGTGPGVIVVGAHFDHGEMGLGAIDNWTGASLLPSLYQALAKTAPKHTILFIGFTDEEKGLIGSSGYVAALAPADKAGIRAMIALDSLGVGPIKVWADVIDKTLQNQYEIVAERDKMAVVYVHIPGVATDSVPFAQAKIPTLTLHSIGDIQQLHLLDSPRDQLNAVKLDDLYRSYGLIVDYIQQVDRVLP